jgi:hypothetical protein
MPWPLAYRKLFPLSNKYYTVVLKTCNEVMIFKIKIKILGSEFQTSGSSKTAQWATKKDNASACLCFLNYLAFLRPAADRAVSILPLIVRRGLSYGFLWADSIIQQT